MTANSMFAVSRVNERAMWIVALQIREQMSEQ